MGKATRRHGESGKKSKTAWPGCLSLSRVTICPGGEMGERDDCGVVLDRDKSGVSDL